MNKYEVQEVIDQGAYGVVLKAYNKQTHRYVAIKKFKEGDQDQQVKKSIQREIKMLKMLRGPYVIDLKEALKRYQQILNRKGKVYLIFEYMQKNVLNLLQQYDTGLPPDLINTLMYQLMKALKSLHSAQIIHRDIKPQNLLLNSHLHLKLCDFGFTRSTTSPGEPLTDYVATRWYRSPQLLVGDHYSKPMDMWAAGCIMGELIDGMPMFPGENEMDQLYLIKKCLGELTKRQLEVFYGNQRYVGLKFPEIRRVETLESKYIGKISKSALSFLKACLRMDQFQRITAADALKHPYFLTLASKDSQEDIISPKHSPTAASQHPQPQSTHQTIPAPIHHHRQPKLSQDEPLHHLHQRTPSLANPNSQGLGLKAIYNTSLKLANTIQLSNDLKKDLLSPRSKLRYLQQPQAVIKQESGGNDTGKTTSRKKEEHNLPKIKEKSQKTLQHKAASQPLMILNQVPKVPVQSLPEGPSLFNLSVMGHSKSIMKLKKY